MPEPLAATDREIARGRVKRIFEFLQAFNQIRNPVPRLITEGHRALWLDDVPQASTVKVASVGEPSADEDPDEGLVLRVKRPRLTQCPPPPPALADWLEGDWPTPEHPAQHKATLTTNPAGKEVVEQFSADSKRVEAFERWRAHRDAWASMEVPLRRADKLFQRLYALHGELQRESERFELVLGDGQLCWTRPDGEVLYPVVIQRVQLEFDADVPEFRIIETDGEVELHTALLRALEVDGKNIASCKEELVRGGIHPLLKSATDGFLARLALTIAPNGVLVPERTPAKEFPQFYRRPVIFLRPRAMGFAKALESIIADIEKTGAVPRSLSRIAGIDATGERQEGDRLPASDVLLCKEANPEQIQIVQRLHDHGSVLVQGPPGTGKSHTIGNLIGHLLAQGKSVLVTSHTTKALSVLRGHIVEALRPLCVSVLDNDVESRRQLEHAVTNIADRLSREDRTKLTAESVSLEKERIRIREQVDTARRELREARLDEHREVVVAGQKWSPCDAARLVAAGKDADSWIPGALQPVVPLPLSREEIEELYRTNTGVNATDERDLAQPLPDLASLPQPVQFAALVRDVKCSASTPDEPQWWEKSPESLSVAALEEAARQIAAIGESLKVDGWMRDALLAGLVGGGATEPWDNLAKCIEEAWALNTKASELLVRFDPQLPAEQSPTSLEAIAQELLAHIGQNGSVGFWARLSHGKWAQFLKSARVAGEPPSSAEHLEALLAEASLRRLRAEMGRRWAKLATASDGPAWDQLGARPEVGCHQFAGEIRRCLSWNTSVLVPGIERLAALGFRWQPFIEARPACAGERATLVRLEQALTEALPRVIEGRICSTKKALRLQELAGLSKRLRTGPNAGATLQNALTAAVASLDASGYEAAFRRAETLRGLESCTRRRRTLLEGLKVAAPGWAEAIRQRSGVHGATQPQGDPYRAWTWAQVHAELERRATKSLSELQTQLEKLERRLRELTVQVIDRRAWSKQLERTSLPQQQALVGWLDLIRRIGRGTGRRAPILRAQAARQMKECRGAVPVWIMPLSRVTEMFDEGAKFDVVIVDEASQSDVMGLVALYLGRSVVVVGDHEQVSPSAVGQQLSRITTMIDEHLSGVPNKALYDGKTSIYDLARQSFGGLICLTEHFRCYPQIIEFSRWLSYNGNIKPLREPTADAVRPFTVAYRVTGAIQEEKVNKAEAEHIASLLIACTQMPEYRNATFGVVSLLGDEQAAVIDQFVRSHMTEGEYSRRRILCGNAAQFQGDERDVMFLSVVYVGTDGPLTRHVDTMYRQRFNVAASRARDQMWVVHSLDVGLHLQPDDLRRRLIEHAADPTAVGREVEKKATKTQSDFERRVLERLIRAGWTVIPQYPVGAFSIDLVVDGAGGRLAVECDGERFHTPERLDDDMARQAILERLGWRFVRIRGSLFYRDPDRAMKPVFERLEQLGISPKKEVAVQIGTTDLQERVIRRAEALRQEWSTGEPTFGAAEPQALRPNTLESAGPPPSVSQRVSSPPPSAPPVRKAVQEAVVIPLPKREAPRAAEAKPTRARATVASESSTPAAKRAPVQAEVAAPARLLGAAAEAVVDLEPNASERRLVILKALVAKLPADESTCPECKGRLQLRVGQYGPYLKCQGRSCAGKHSLSVPLITAAVKEAALRCACGGNFVLRRGPTATFLGCSTYPECRKTFSWRDV